MGKGSVNVSIMYFGDIKRDTGTGEDGLLEVGPAFLKSDLFPQRTTTLCFWMLALKILEPTATGMLLRGVWISRGCWMTWR